MNKTLKIEFSGEAPMYADLLTDEAPETCAAFCAALPYQDRVVGHAKWSGHVISLFTDVDFDQAENTRVHGVCPGDILYNPHVHDAAPHPNEISVVYGPADMRTYSGYALANYFARIRPEHMTDLYRLGIDINRHGERTVTVSLVYD